MDAVKRLLASDGFQSVMDRVRVHSCSYELPVSIHLTALPDLSVDDQYLVMCCSYLAKASVEEARDLALRIAVLLLRKDGATEELRASAGQVLESCLNYPAIRLARERELLPPDLESRLGIAAQMESIRRYARSSYVLSDGEVIRLNEFQRRLWLASRAQSQVSVSAPTSAGKSYLLQKLTQEHIYRTSSSVLYLVPTRSLIREVSTELQQTLGDAIDVISLPIRPVLENARQSVYVLTQERCNILLNSGLAKQVGLVLVDEAQKVGDGSRGVLLQHMLDRVAAKWPNARTVYCSPMSSNPEILLSQERVGESFSVEDVTVNQNIFMVTQMPRKTALWEIGLQPNGRDLLPVGQLRLPHKPTTQPKRLAFVASAIGGQQAGNIVYAAGAADAEKLAALIAETLEEELGDSGLEDLVKLAAKTVHEKYALTKVLPYRVAYHYGNMPFLLRSEVERAFNEGRIRFLVCTSTLLEGVNTTCRNIFLRKPTKGRSNPMKSTDFWNLAGRAGRWGREFEGNVYCIDPSSWEVEPPADRHRSPISRAVDIIVEKRSAFLEFARGDGKQSGRDQLSGLFAQGVSYLYSTPSAIARRDSFGQLANDVDRLKESIGVSDDVVLRNPGIHPTGLERLRLYFIENEARLEEMLPPEVDSEDAAAGFTRVLGRIGNCFGGAFTHSGRNFYLAITLVQWMRGLPVPAIVGSRIAYLTKKKPGRSLQAGIRETLDDIENVCRFEAPRAIAAYLDVLNGVLRDCGRTDILEEIPDIGLQIEMGMSHKTLLALTSLGLSRSTAAMVFEYMVDGELWIDEVCSWLRDQDLDLLDLPGAARAEIETVLSRKEDR